MSGFSAYVFHGSAMFKHMFENLFFNCWRIFQLSCFLHLLMDIWVVKTFTVTYNYECFCVDACFDFS